MADVSDAREQLLKENARFRKLADEHQDCEARLAELQSRRWLSDEEQLEEVRIKKRKLAIKDEMESMVRTVAVG